jgi:hypothetical protein
VLVWWTGVVEVVPLSAPGTELDVVGLTCGPVVVDGAVSRGAPGEVVVVGASEVGGAGSAGGWTVVGVGAIVVVVVVPLWVIVMLSPGASPRLTSLMARVVLVVGDVFTSSQSDPNPTKRMAITAVDQRTRKRAEIGCRRAAMTRETFMTAKSS